MTSFVVSEPGEELAYSNSVIAIGLTLQDEATLRPVLRSEVIGSPLKLELV